MRRLFLIAAIFLSLAGSVLSQAAEVDVPAFIKEAGVSYEADFSVDAPLDVWEKILDNPYLVGKLWKVYRFWPRYEMAKKGSGVYVTDPSGLEGRVVGIRTARNTRVFYGEGRMNHWAIPVDATGRALFFFRYGADGDRIRGRVTVYVSGDRDFTNFLLKVGSFIMRYFIEERFKNNFQDMQKILSDIRKDPDRIRGKLKEEDLKEFNKIFPAALPVTQSLQTLP